MKNQNDLIVAGVAFVLAVIVVCVAIFTKREPPNPGSPATIDQAMPQLPGNDVVLADSLPGSQSNGGGGGAGMMGGPMGGRGPGFAPPGAGLGAPGGRGMAAPGGGGSGPRMMGAAGGG